jgi:hypothetical protein
MNIWNLKFGSALGARGDSLLYRILAVIVGILALVVIVLVAIKVLAKALHFPGPEERMRRRRTTGRDVSQAAGTYDLTRPEVALLRAMCRKYKVPNVNYFFRKPRQTYDLFQEAWADLVNSNEDHPQVGLLFSMLEKVNKTRLVEQGIRSTKMLPQGLEVFYLDEKHRKRPMTIVRQDAEEMYLTLPIDEQGYPIQIPELTRVIVHVENVGEVSADALVRVLRYQTIGGREVMVVTQSTDVRVHIRQDFTRIPCNLPCRASPLTEKKTEGGAVVFEAAGNAQDGLLEDYTANTCRFIVPFPVAAGDALLLQLAFEKGRSAELVVKATRATADGGESRCKGSIIQMNDAALGHILPRANHFIVDKSEG